MSAYEEADVRKCEAANVGCEASETWNELVQAIFRPCSTVDLLASGVAMPAGTPLN